MKRKDIIVALIAMLFVFIGCNKNNDPEDIDEPAKDTTETRVDKFVGRYQLYVEYDVLIDGEEDDEPTGIMSGTLVITATSDTTVNVHGEMEFGSGNAPLYETTGTVDKDGVLHLEPNTYEGGAVPLQVTYYDIVYDSPIVFRSFMMGYMQEHQLEYEMTNTATKL